MEAFLVSTALVALAEMGDKTQLLSLMLAARFRRPWPIIAGILVATLANHALAALAGGWLHGFVNGEGLRWIVGGGFAAMAAWMLVPDKPGGEPARYGSAGVLATTLIAFFVAEMGDKTQVATIALAARYGSLVPVVLGTTFGMMLANVPAVLLGERICAALPMKLLQRVAAGICVVLAVAALAY